MNEDLAPVIRDIHEKVTRQSVLMETLIQPGGRIPQLEEEVEELKEFRTTTQATVKATVKTTATIWGVVSAALGLLGHAIWDAVRGVPHK